MTSHGVENCPVTKYSEVHLCWVYSLEKLNMMKLLCRFQVSTFDRNQGNLNYE